MTYGINIIFGRVSINVVTAYGVYYKIQQFVFFAAFGLNNALIPIVAFNYGMLYTLLLMLAGGIALQLLAEPLAGIFALSEETQILCIQAIRIISLGYLLVGANVVYQGIFQALGNGVRSLVVSLLRLVLIALPLAYLLTALQNAQDMVWWAFPAAEGAALLTALAFMKKLPSRNWKD